jgi:hypothetical protein
MSQITRLVASITEDRRADYLFDTRTASDAVGCPPNKFADWWYRTRRKLIALGEVEPGELAAEMAAVFAIAAERQAANRRKRLPPP